VLTRCGDDLFSIAVKRPEEAQALARRLRETGAWLDVVPGIDSVVVRFDILAKPAEDARKAIEATLQKGVEPIKHESDLVEIPVIYGGQAGPDLDELSERTGLTQDEIVRLHTGREYRVEMVGFTPGFAFIGGLDERLRVPRRKEPRQQVPAGSVGIADERTGLYALASPGGWTLIGRTSYPLFDATAERPFALEPGMRVRFRAVADEEA
jgi:KipI family sensor histidine kinase inhibitor